MQIPRGVKERLAPLYISFIQLYLSKPSSSLLTHVGGDSFEQRHTNTGTLLFASTPQHITAHPVRDLQNEHRSGPHRKMKMTALLITLASVLATAQAGAACSNELLASAGYTRCSGLDEGKPYPHFCSLASLAPSSKGEFP